jgi:hypothetical protein
MKEMSPSWSSVKLRWSPLSPEKAMAGRPAALAAPTVPEKRVMRPVFLPTLGPVVTRAGGPPRTCFVVFFNANVIPSAGNALTYQMWSKPDNTFSLISHEWEIHNTVVGVVIDWRGTNRD